MGRVEVARCGEGIGLISKALFTSDSAEWATPQSLIDQLSSEFTFTLDVCATQDNTKAPAFYAKEIDGLKQDWYVHGKNGACWMNPPYGRDIGKWVEKAYAESLKGATVVCLLPSRTDTRWFHDWVFGKSEIRFIKGRLKFVGAPSSAPFPSILAIYRPISAMI
jgi:site-specific DNA-methyltransferase (adenine-specific)